VYNFKQRVTSFPSVFLTQTPYTIHGSYAKKVTVHGNREGALLRRPEVELKSKRGYRSQKCYNENNKFYRDEENFLIRAVFTLKDKKLGSYTH
jgi:hypothetical protein